MRGSVEPTDMDFGSGCSVGSRSLASAKSPEQLGKLKNNATL